MKVLLADKQDRFASCLAQAMSSKDFLWITPEEIVDQLKVFHTISRRGEDQSSWSINNLDLPFDKITWCLCRLPGLDLCLFDTFIPEDREYAHQEFHAYLFFALSLMTNIMNKPSPSALCGATSSYLAQFEFARKIGLPIPRAISTTLRTNAIKFGESCEWRVALKENEYEIKKWRLISDGEKNMVLSGQPSVYHLVEKLEGEPHFSCVVGSHVFSSCGSSVNTLKKVALDGITHQKVLQIGQNFGLQFYEVKTVSVNGVHYFEYFSSVPSLDLCSPWKMEIRQRLLELYP